MNGLSGLDMLFLTRKFRGQELPSLPRREDPVSINTHQKWDLQGQKREHVKKAQ